MAPRKRCKNVGNPCVFAFLGLWAVSKIKKYLTANRKPSNPLLKSLVFTVRHPWASWMPEPSYGSVPWICNGNLQNHWDSLGFLRIRLDGMPGGLRSVLRTLQNLTASWKRWKPLGFLMFPHVRWKGTPAEIKVALGWLAARIKTTPYC